MPKPTARAAAPGPPAGAGGLDGRDATTDRKVDALGAARRFRRSWSCAVLGILVLVGAYLLTRLDAPMQRSGDSFSDANALNAGKHFGEDGFVRLRFLPVQVPGPLPEHPQYYTHYPPLPDLICGALYRLGARDLATFRLLPTIASLAALWVAFLFFHLFMGGAAAAWATALMGASSVFLLWAQSLHQHAYYQLIVVLFLYLLLSPPIAGKPRRPVLLWVVLFMQSLCSFEYYPLSLIMLGAVAAFPERVWTRRQLAGIASALFVGFGLHLAQNAWALGWQPAVDDLTAAASRRSTGGSLCTIPLAASFSSVFALLTVYYLPVWCACIAGVALLPRRARVPLLRDAGMLWWMLGLGSISWWILMRQHATCHDHDVRHAMFFLFGSAGLLLDRLHSLRRDQAAPVIAVLALLVALSQSALSANRDPWISPSALAGLQRVLPPDHEVWTTYVGPPVLMYYLDRPVVYVDDADSPYFRIHGTEIGRPVLALRKDAPRPVVKPVAFVLDLREPVKPSVRDLLRGGRRVTVPGADYLQVVFLSP